VSATAAASTNGATGSKPRDPETAQLFKDLVLAYQSGDEAKFRALAARLAKPPASERRAVPTASEAILALLEVER
jgi:hypothetical protein